MKTPRGVRKDHGWLSLRFRWNGKRRTEYLGLKDTRENMIVARNLSEQIRAELLLGTFDYAKRFPNSKHARTSPQSDLTLRKFIETWLEETKAKVTEESYRDYWSQVNSHILPYPIAGMLMKDISDGDVSRWVGELKAKAAAGAKLSNHRINMVLTRMRTIFKTAARRPLSDGRRMISEDPMKFVDNLRETKSDVDPFTLEEARALIDTAEGWFRNFLTLQLFTGLRPNEALALKWDDIDWRRNMILIRRNKRRSGIGPTKTAAGERDVQMPEMVRNALSAQQALTRLKGPFVFANVVGIPLSLDVIRHGEWKRVLVKAHIRPRPIYHCRHSYATLSLESGETPHHVASQLGHTTVELVYSTYSRWTRKPESRAGKALNESYQATSIKEKSA